jgi:hypothetical protein
VRRVRHDDAQAVRRGAGAHLEAPVTVGGAYQRDLASRGRRVGRRAHDDRHVGRDDGLARPLLAHQPAHDDGRGWRRWWRRRWWRGVSFGIGRARVGLRLDDARLEVQRVLDADRRWLAVDLRRRELDLLGRFDGGLVEAVASALLHDGGGHASGGVQVQRQRDVSRQPRVERLGGVARLDALDDRGRLRELGRRGRWGGCARRRQRLVELRACRADRPERREGGRDEGEAKAERAQTGVTLSGARHLMPATAIAPPSC